jgi:toxin YoeB
MRWPLDSARSSTDGVAPCLRQRKKDRRLERVPVQDRNALEDLEWFAAHDSRSLKKALELMRHVLREPHAGIGKPEPLKGFPNTWSRRITQEHRLVYVVFDDRIVVSACRYHYGAD